MTRYDFIQIGTFVPPRKPASEADLTPFGHYSQEIGFPGRTTVQFRIRWEGKSTGRVDRWEDRWVSSGR